MCCHARLLPALSGINAPSSTGGVTPLRLPALTLRGYLHVVQDGSAFFPRAFGLVRRVVLFSNGMMTRRQCIEYLISTPINYTCSNLAAHLDGVSQDAVSDFLVRSRTTASNLWQQVKGVIHDSADSYLII